MNSPGPIHHETSIQPSNRRMLGVLVFGTVFIGYMIVALVPGAIRCLADADDDYRAS